ncbi:MAG TPA: VWA domain-containing protein [Thermoanaerobaculia bacterium]|nr:VWA domain-containing protein [Thermoanaerobaculia bacterium]
MRQLHIRGLALPLCALLLAPPLAAQQPAQEPPPSLFGEQIEVRVVNLEAVVTDRQGNRVTDLNPTDFQLTVDGKAVPIQYFTEVRGGQAVAPPASPSDNAAEAAPVQGLPSLAPGEPVGTSYLVYIDDYFSVAARRDEVLRGLKDELSRLGPEDRMAIVSFDGRRIDMLSSWSRSSRDLGRALDRAMVRPAYGAQRFTDLRNFKMSIRTVREFEQIQSPIESGRLATPRDRLDLQEMDYASRLSQQVERSIGAAVSTLRGFASPPGRKVMLMLSGGWPFDAIRYVLNDPTRAEVISTEIPSGYELFSRLTDTANRLGYTVYPVDVPGLETDGANAEVIDVALDAVDPLNQFPGPGAMLREQEMHTALQYVAIETGGRALLDSTRLTALEGTVADTRSYYWLGFVPEWQGNDKRHDIKLEVTRPGLKVRSRDNFLDLSSQAEVSLAVESAMLFGTPPGSTPMPIQLGEPVRAGRKEMDLPLSLAIPVDAFTTLPVDGKHVAELQLRVHAMDEDGARSDMPVVPIRIATKELPTAGKYVRYDTKLRLRQIQQHVVLAVFDPVSGKISTAETDVKPPKR